jgi:hypothetical protein
VAPSDRGAAARYIIPEVGEHSVHILTELGSNADEIDAWRGAKVVRQP